jgi:signal transduction histidine kinase
VAKALSTPRFALTWSAGPARGLADARQTALRDQIVHLIPDLARAGRTLTLTAQPEADGIGGSVTLADGGHLAFRTYAGTARAQLSSWHILPMLLPTLLLGALAWLLFRATIRTLQTLVEALPHIEAREPSDISERGPDEVRQLIRAFNEMQRRIRRSQAERTQSMLAIGHDLRTPLARLQLRLDNAPLGNVARAELERDIAEMLLLLESLQAFVEASGSQIPPERIDIAIMAATLVDTAADQGAAATYCGPESLEVMARAVSIRRALSNLVENALHYAGNVRVNVRSDSGAVEIRIEDDGPGIPESRMEDVFQPFFRLDTARSRDTPGMGLGLPIVREAIGLEDGTLQLVNRPEGGLAAIVRLPGLDR